MANKYNENNSFRKIKGNWYYRLMVWNGERQSGEVSRDCSKVVTFTDNDGNPIDYDCNAIIVEESLIDLEKKIEDTISTDDVELIKKKLKNL